MLAQFYESLSRHVSEHERLSLADLIRMAHGEAHLVLICILAILSMILSPLPMNSLIFGIPLFCISCLYLMNHRLEHAKGALFHRSVACVRWRVFMPGAKRWVARIQTLGKPRWPFVMALETRLVSGLSLMVLALIILLPIPFANIPGCLGMLCVAFGLMQRDGLLVALGYGVVLVHLSIIGAVKYLLFWA
jgi:hypothetical protein